jgi:hypothetical protein
VPRPPVGRPAHRRHPEAPCWERCTR